MNTQEEIISITLIHKMFFFLRLGLVFLTNKKSIVGDYFTFWRLGGFF